MKKLNLVLTSVLISAALIFTACEKDEEDPKTIVDIAVENGYNVLAAALTNAGLVDDLEGVGPFTVFAPTDAAFNAAGITASNVGQVEGLENILKYHVVAGKLMSGDLNSGELTMLSGATTDVDAMALTVNGISIISPFDLEGSNGVIHSINGVLMPPKNIVQTAIDAGYNVLAAGLVAAGLDDDLQGQGPFTVFAPTDAAFNAAGITAENIGDTPGLAEILLYHVLSGNVTSGDLTTSDVTTLNSQDISIDAGALTVNGISIASPYDVVATNGTIHTINGVLIPAFDLVTSAQFYGYNTLAAAVIEANLVDALKAAGPFTVFAPTDAAFAAAGITAANVDMVADLDKILLYHVISGNITSGDLSTGEFEMLSGKYASIDASALTIDGASIINPYDVMATNGTIHTIDAVILPAKNIVETAAATADLSILVSLLEKYPAVVDALSDETGTFTVFAPTNAAFAELLGVIGQTSADDIPEDVLLSVLQYHVLASEVYAANLSDGLSATSLNGEDIMVAAAGDSYTISGAAINTADVMTSNGVVHIMDNVLVPPSAAMFVNTIVEPAYFNKNFTTLVAAVKAASPAILDALLAAEGFTLFAPTNDAFIAAGISELPDQATLDAVLTYHLVQGVVMSSSLPATTVAAPAAISTFGGSDFYLTNKGDGVFINGNTQVTGVDIDPEASGSKAAMSNVVHVINRTLIPPSQDIVAIAIAGGFSQLAAALTEAGLVSTLQGEGPFTVFAPTNAAFDALYAALGNLQGPAEVDDALLEAVLLYHVLGLRAFSTDLEDQLMPATVGGAQFTINVSGSGVSISDGGSTTDANVSGVNILGTNGVIHVIDKVLLPPAK
jgi:transforming growth factor-beta-induced protein